MELNDLRIFVQVAEAGGFRRAGAALKVDQSALSRRIRSLEDALGVALFERHASGVRLTGAGERFLREVRTTLAQLDLAVRSAEREGSATRGAVKVGVVASISSTFLNTLFHAYHRDHPDVVVSFREGAHQQHYAALKEAAMDVAFVTGHPEVDGLDTEHLWHEAVFVAVPDADIRARSDRLSFADIVSDIFHVSDVPPGPDTHDYIIQHLSRIGARPRIVTHQVGREALMSIVGLGHGITLVCGSEVRVHYPGVSFVKLVAENLPFSAVWRPDNDNPALRRLLSDTRILSKKILAHVDTPMPDPKT